MTEHRLPIEVYGNGNLRALTFSPDGKHLLSGGGPNGVEVWRAQDGLRRATPTMDARDIRCLAVSRDGKWIAGGTKWGSVFMWDANTYEKAWEQSIEGYADFRAINFSPDSTRLILGSLQGGTATIWDVARRRKVGTLNLEQSVIAARHSPDGDKIATATRANVCVWDGHNGRLLVNIPVAVTSEYNKGLAWLNNSDIVVISGNTVKRLNASTGSLVSELPAPASTNYSCLAVPKTGKFIACSTGHTVRFWDMSTESTRSKLLGHIEHPEEIRSIALSQGDDLLAIGEENGKTIISNLFRIIDSIPVACLHPTFLEPSVQIDNAILNAWKHDELVGADESLTTAIEESYKPRHHLFVARSLIRARQGHSNAALVDADKAIGIKPSVIAYVAKSLAHIGKGEHAKAYQTCDIAFEHFYSSRVTLLLLLFKAIIISIAEDHSDAISRVDNLIDTVPWNSTCYMVQAYMYLLQGNMYMACSKYENAIASYRSASSRLRDSNEVPLFISLVSGWKFHHLHITIRQRHCEALYASDRKTDAIELLLEIISMFEEEVSANKSVTKWVSDFAQKCLSESDSIGDIAPNATQAVTSHATISPLLMEWAKATLAHVSWQDSLRSAVDFVVSKFTVFRVIYEHLEKTGRKKDAGDCFHQMVSELVQQENARDEQTEWVLQNLENFGDTATSIGQYDDAISRYSDALSLNPPTPQRFLAKRSKAYIAKGLWSQALNDANNMIEVDPLSPWGYERKHAALHRAEDFGNAISAFEEMHLKMKQSSDPDIRAFDCQYVNPEDTRGAIRMAVKDTTSDSPRVLINILSGRLFDKTEQAASFESLPIFNKLVSSMTTRIDSVRIKCEVEEYYRYGIFSHKWEANEPLYDQVIRVVVHNLTESPTHDKLKMFCKMVQDAGLHWAWSDTCCINKTDNVVLQEALVAMFKWYQSAALTVVFLLDVDSLSLRGGLAKSIWNTRAWTFQEYHASKVVRFYTKDWKLYMNLDIPNHKESPAIIAEMEEATGVPARALMALRPGWDSIREKLCLASTRETTRVEDAAYSLLGIFSMHLNILYGEGDQSLGRLLAQLLATSGATSILAWTGESGSFNSCLPKNIIVFKQLLPPEIPPTISTTEMENLTTMLRASLSSSSVMKLVMKLYDQLHELPLPFYVGQRLKLPCITFKLGGVTAARNDRGSVFRAQTDALGVVEIISEEDLSRFSHLYLIHPWIDFLLDRHGNVDDTIPERSNDGRSFSLGGLPPSPGPSPVPEITQGISLFRRITFSLGGRSATFSAQDEGTLQPPSEVSREDKRRQAFEMVVRLKQPFGALLLAESSGRFRRVATKIMITAKLQEITPGVLNKLVSSVRLLDVL